MSRIRITDYEELGKQLRTWYQHQSQKISEYGRWTHEDQMELSQTYKCVLVIGDNGAFRVMGLRDSDEACMQVLKQMAGIDPLCEKAVALIIAGTLL